MKPDLSELPDEEYEAVVASWEEYAGITTAELMERHDTTECQSTEIYAANEGIMNLIQFYYLDDAIKALHDYILNDDDFAESCTCDNFKWAVSMFIENISFDSQYHQVSYFMDNPDMGTAWLAVDCYGDTIYWNMDEIWAYWVGLNKENYFDA